MYTFNTTPCLVGSREPLIEFSWLTVWLDCMIKWFIAFDVQFDIEKNALLLMLLENGWFLVGKLNSVTKTKNVLEYF